MPRKKRDDGEDQELRQRELERGHREYLDWRKKVLNGEREFVKTKNEELGRWWDDNKDLAAEEVDWDTAPRWTKNDAVDFGLSMAGDMPRRALAWLERLVVQDQYQYVMGHDVREGEGRMIEAIGHGLYTFGDAAGVDELRVVYHRESQRQRSIGYHIDDVDERATQLEGYPERSLAENVGEAKQRIRERRAAEGA